MTLRLVITTNAMKPSLHSGNEFAAYHVSPLPRRAAGGERSVHLAVHTIAPAFAPRLIVYRDLKVGKTCIDVNVDATYPKAQSARPTTHPARQTHSPERRPLRATRHKERQRPCE